MWPRCGRSSSHLTAWVRAPAMLSPVIFFFYCKTFSQINYTHFFPPNKNGLVSFRSFQMRGVPITAFNQRSASRQKCRACTRLSRNGTSRQPSPAIADPPEWDRGEFLARPRAGPGPAMEDRSESTLTASLQNEHSLSLGTNPKLFAASTSDPGPLYGKNRCMI